MSAMARYKGRLLHHHELYDLDNFGNKKKMMLVA
jgi:hypothetical protein